MNNAQNKKGIVSILIVIWTIVLYVGIVILLSFILWGLGVLACWAFRISYTVTFWQGLVVATVFVFYRVLLRKHAK